MIHGYGTLIQNHSKHTSGRVGLVIKSLAELSAIIIFCKAHLHLTYALYAALTFARPDYSISEKPRPVQLKRILPLPATSLSTPMICPYGFHVKSPAWLRRP